VEAAGRPRGRRGLLPPHPQARRRPPGGPRLLPRVPRRARRGRQAGGDPAPGREGAAGRRRRHRRSRQGARGRDRRAVGAPARHPRQGDRRLEAAFADRSDLDRGAGRAAPAVPQGREVEPAARSDQGRDRAAARGRGRGQDRRALRGGRDLRRQAPARSDGAQHLQRDPAPRSGRPARDRRAGRQVPRDGPVAGPDRHPGQEGRARGPAGGRPCRDPARERRAVDRAVRQLRPGDPSPSSACSSSTATTPTRWRA
jgi:hypothetical protein